MTRCNEDVRGEVERREKKKDLQPSSAKSAGPTEGLVVRAAILGGELAAKREPSQVGSDPKQPIRRSGAVASLVQVFQHPQVSEQKTAVKYGSSSSSSSSSGGGGGSVGKGSREAN
ncbi:uncharacterized protein V6R79_013893 [Siganus canaliculatus]